jgi:RNA polymerase sigma-70 factor (ECF subfamily)
MPGSSDEIGRLIPHLRRFARALVRGHSLQAADDIVQETIVLAMRAEGLARGPALTIWCFAALLRVHRLRQRHAVFERQGGVRAIDVERDGSGSAAPAPVAFLSKDIARLDALPLQNREVLLLVVLAGMDYARVAEVLTLSRDTVVALLTEARDMLAKAEHWASPPSARTASPGQGVLQPSSGASGKPRVAPYLRVVK